MKFGNYFIGNLVTRINQGSIRRLRYIKLEINNTTLKILKLLYNEGVIRTFIIKKDKIWLYYKYHNSRVAFKLSLISKPSNRQYWSLRKLSCKFNNNNFSGFYIISTQRDIYSSHECLIFRHISGEAIIKVEI